MKKQLFTLLDINRSDFLYALGLTAGPWLLVYVVTAVVMVLVRPDESIMIGGAIIPIGVGLAAFAVTSGNTMISFTQAIQFGRTRKRALGLTLGMAGGLTLASVVLGTVLLVLERHSMPLWRALSRNPGLLLDDFGVVWWAIPTAALAGFAIGLIYGATVLRFGGKAIWGTMVCWLGGLALFQMLPWKTHEVTNILIPVLAALMALGTAWSVWYMLRHSLTK